MDLFARRLWLGEENDPIRPKGVNRRDKVSNMEIWAECMGKNPADMKPSDSYAISALMTRLPGWDRSKKRTWSRLYGMQRYYMRTKKAEAWAFLA